MFTARPLNSSNDPIEAAGLVADTYFPHELRVLNCPDFSLRLQASALGPLTVGILGWGADVSIDCAYPGSYEINIPLSGHLESLHHGRRIRSVRGTATVFEADRRIRITNWSANCVAIGLKLDRDYLAEKYRQFTARDDDPVLPEQLNVSGPQWSTWLNLLRFLPGQAASAPDLLRTPVAVEQLSGAITDSLLAGITCDTVHHADNAPAQPRQVKRVLDAIHADPTRPWTLGDMAALAGVSGRRLQQSFRASLGQSPTEYLRSVRLERAHQDLLDGRPGVSVRDIAAKWGFVHTGRFSQLYRQKYRQAPSDTLRGR